MICGGEGVLFIWAICVCAAPKGRVFSAILIRNRVSALAILAILVINRAWFFHSSQ